MERVRYSSILPFTKWLLSTPGVCQNDIPFSLSLFPHFSSFPPSLHLPLPPLLPFLAPLLPPSPPLSLSLSLPLSLSLSPSLPPSLFVTHTNYTSEDHPGRGLEAALKAMQLIFMRETYTWKVAEDCINIYKVMERKWVRVRRRAREGRREGFSHFTTHPSTLTLTHSLTHLISVQCPDPYKCIKHRWSIKIRRHTSFSSNVIGPLHSHPNNSPIQSLSLSFSPLLAGICICRDTV